MDDDDDAYADYYGDGFDDWFCIDQHSECHVTVPAEARHGLDHWGLEVRRIT